MAAYRPTAGFLGRVSYALDAYDATYCYRRSSVVCVSVGHVREPCKTAESIEMPFRGAGWGRPRNRALDGVKNPTGRGNAILWVVRPFETHWESVLRAGFTQQKNQ